MEHAPVIADAAQATNQSQSGAVTEFRRPRTITNQRDIPTFSACLSVRSGLIELRQDDQQVVAILAVGEKEAAVLWTGSAADRDVLIAAQSRIRAANWNLVETLQTTRDIIALCYDSESHRNQKDVTEDSAALRTFDKLLADALRLGASDIHLNMLRHSMQVRMRVHGDLIDHSLIPKSDGEALARAAYTAGDVDSRTGKPVFNPREYQDASVTRHVTTSRGMRQVKLRWASGPVWPDAFDVQLRAQATGGTGGIKPLSELGYRHEQVSLIEQALMAPAGAIILVGITGSGKTTTLASAARSWLDRFEGRRALRSIEDPPEIEIEGARQMPVVRSGADGGVGAFAKALRANLRMDPDAILVGEVRDEETATLCQQAIQTGHFVFATVHAGSPFAGVRRLEELGIKRHYLCSEEFLNLVIYQKLIPLVCPHCARPYEEHKASVPADVRSALDKFMPTTDPVLLRGPGCDRCHGGNRGRTVVASMLAPDRSIREMLRRNEDPLAEAYWRGGLAQSFPGCQALSLREQARDMIRAGDVCPVMASLALGGLVDGSTSAEEKNWYHENQQGAR